MAQKTALQPYSLPGRTRSFSAKTAAAVVTAVSSLRRKRRRLDRPIGRGEYLA